jgi:tetratricopeptide (TPR) repeat protein
MAVVYFAKDLRHFRDVAIKIFRREGNEPDEGSERFLQEIKIAARLSHPNILPLHDSGDDHGLLYYVMPYVPGESLRQRLEREGALPLADALKIATDIANALGYAHSHGVIHRDIKPENILFIAGNAVVADFGIARAISAGGWDEWKLAGPAGTPAYMSPEQGRGGSRVDGRSDLYSLGCVLYEMLTGEPPFRGNTPEELVAQHAEVEPEPVSSIRPTLPRDVQLAVGRALAKHPADRYQTALQMAESLARLQASTSGEHEQRVTPSEPLPAARRPPALANWVRRWGGPSFIAAGLAAAMFWTKGVVDTRRLDADLLLLAPLVHRDSVPAELDGEQCSRLLAHAIGRWEDVRTADSRWTDDQLARLGHRPTLNELLTVARDGGAGRLLSGEVWTGAGDSVKVRVVMYDVRRGPRVIKEHTVAIAPGLGDIGARFSELADSMVLPRAQSPMAITGMLGTSVKAAWEQYDSAHAALSRWDLEQAEDHFTHAIATDPNYQLAYLWRAQTRSWQGQRLSLWRDDARRGIENPALLTQAEREWGRALVALGEARFPDACELFNEMLRRDSLDFRGWYGRGDCRARDPVVIRDDNSPSKFAFRASYAAAIRDYTRALTLIPSSNMAFRGAAFDRLRGVLFAENRLLRPGRLLDADSVRFAAFPEIMGDTLAFVPWTMEQISVRPAALYPTRRTAVSRNLQTLDRIVSVWAAEFPTSANAQKARALTWEVMGQLDGNQTPSNALTAIRAARSLSRDSIESVELRAIQFRLLFKSEQFEAARLLADSVFAEVRSDPTRFQEVAGMALVLGRPSLAGNLLRVESNEFTTALGEPVPTPIPLRETALRFKAFAVVGAPRDSVDYWYGKTQAEIRAYGAPPERKKMRDALIDLPTLMLPAGWGDTYFQPNLPAAIPLIAFRYAAIRGIKDSIQARFKRTDAGMDINAPWAHPPEFSLYINSIRLREGDTAGAIRVMDQQLNSLRLLHAHFLEEMPPAGTLVRLMLLRMDVASAQGDAATARRWARAAMTLWAEAEPGVQPLLANARRLAQQ